MAAGMKITAFWDISLMMETARTFEMSMYFYETARRHILLRKLHRFG
jgi:hypothetical protein